MLRGLEVVEVGDSVEFAAERMLADGRQQLPVTDHGRLVGVVTAPALAAVLSSPGPHDTVASVVRRDVPAVAPDAPLESAVEPVAREGVVFVVDDGTLVGMLTAEQLATYAAFHAASARQTSSPRAGAWATSS